jgi:hypothetical protein
VADFNECEFDTVKDKRLICGDRALAELEKIEKTTVVIEDLRRTENRRQFLNPVEFPVTDKVIIVAMGPDNRIDLRRSGFQELKSEVGSGINENTVTIALNKEGCAETNLTRCSRTGASGAVAPNLGCTNRISGPKER